MRHDSMQPVESMKRSEWIAILLAIAIGAALAVAVVQWATEPEPVESSDTSGIVT